MHAVEIANGERNGVSPLGREMAQNEHARSGMARGAREGRDFSLRDRALDEVVRTQAKQAEHGEIDQGSGAH
jgi:hypothetical protein